MNRIFVVFALILAEKRAHGQIVQIRRLLKKKKNCFSVAESAQLPS